VATLCGRLYTKGWRALDYFFKTIDKDGCGTLPAAEFRNALLQLNVGAALDGPISDQLVRSGMFSSSTLFYVYQSYGWPTCICVSIVWVFVNYVECAVWYVPVVCPSVCLHELCITVHVLSAYVCVPKPVSMCSSAASNSNPSFASHLGMTGRSFPRSSSQSSTGFWTSI
jgi:hypothetical protein